MRACLASQVTLPPITAVCSWIRCSRRCSLIALLSSSLSTVLSLGRASIGAWRRPLRAGGSQGRSRPRPTSSPGPGSRSGGAAPPRWVPSRYLPFPGGFPDVCRLLCTIAHFLTPLHLVVRAPSSPGNRTRGDKKRSAQHVGYWCKRTLELGGEPTGKWAGYAKSIGACLNRASVGSPSVQARAIVPEWHQPWSALAAQHWRLQGRATRVVLLCKEETSLWLLSAKRN